ncbi:uncharacterized protein LOC142323038 isoform X1 [Lycorma delicatula]|uniref:uncharacterized protein LOC142323038 isoform X1 n=1 Tax=Lycorma delicatula TaxID=130591 RepID=UPI003F51124C
MAQIIGSSDNGFGDEESENDQFPNAKNLKKLGGFHTFGISLPLIKGIEKKGYKTPTPIQRKESSDDINASNQLYFCRICRQHFRYKIPLKRHMQRIHQKEKPTVYSCRPCKIALYTPRKFLEHFKSCPFGYPQNKNIYMSAVQ